MYNRSRRYRKYFRNKVPTKTSWASRNNFNTVIAEEGRVIRKNKFIEDPPYNFQISDIPRMKEWLTIQGEMNDICPLPPTPPPCPVPSLDDFTKNEIYSYIISKYGYPVDVKISGKPIQNTNHVVLNPDFFSEFTTNGEIIVIQNITNLDSSYTENISLLFNTKIGNAGLNNYGTLLYCNLSVANPEGIITVVADNNSNRIFTKISNSNIILTSPTPSTYLTITGVSTTKTLSLLVTFLIISFQ